MQILDQILAWLVGVGTALIERVVPFCVIVGVGILLIQLVVMKLLDKFLNKSKLEKAAHSLIKSVVRVVLYFILGLIAASQLKIDVSSIIALASVLTLAISLAVQSALTNVIGGFTLLYTKPFMSGDFVEIAAESGTVQEIGMTYTKLLTPDNKLIYIPNSSVVAADITNYTVTGTRRVDVAISASYNVPTEKVLEALYAATKVPGAMTDPAPFAAVNKYGDSAIEYVLRVWCATDNYWDVNFALNKNVRDAFDQFGVEMTYPHINVHVDK